MSVCVVVANDDGSRRASHALRAAGWGGVHFEANPSAAVRMTQTGRATVLNVQRADPAAVTEAIAELGGAAYDWRTPPPDLSEEEWSVLYGNTDELTPQKIKRRWASATEKFGATDDDGLRAAFAPWRVPVPTT